MHGLKIVDLFERCGMQSNDPIVLQLTTFGSLGHAKIGDVGAQAIANALQVNQTLTALK